MVPLHSKLKGFEPLCSIINDISENMNIPYQTKITEQDQYLKWKKKFPTMNSRVLKATAIYFSCKKRGVPRTLREISSASGVCPKKIGKYDAMLKILILKLVQKRTSTDFASKSEKTFSSLREQSNSLTK